MLNRIEEIVKQCGSAEVTISILPKLFPDDPKTPVEFIPHLQLKGYPVRDGKMGDQKFKEWLEEKNLKAEFILTQDRVIITPRNMD